MVGHEGPKVLSWCLDMKDKDLLQPKGQLDIVVPHHDMRQLGVWVAFKEGFRLEPECPTVPDG